MSLRCFSQRPNWSRNGFFLCCGDSSWAEVLSIHVRTSFNFRSHCSHSSAVSCSSAFYRLRIRVTSRYRAPYTKNRSYPFHKDGFNVGFSLFGFQKLLSQITHLRDLRYRFQFLVHFAQILYNWLNTLDGILRRIQKEKTKLLWSIAASKNSIPNIHVNVVVPRTVL